MIGGRAKVARHPLWWRPKAAVFVLALNKAIVPALHSTYFASQRPTMALTNAQVERPNKRMSCVPTIKCVVSSQ